MIPVCGVLYAMINYHFGLFFLYEKELVHLSTKFKGYTTLCIVSSVR